MRALDFQGTTRGPPGKGARRVDGCAYTPYAITCPHMATIRQRKAMEILVEKGGKTSMAPVLREAGYSEVIARNPDRVTKTKSWAELLDEMLPESSILQAHKDLLEQKESSKAKVAAIDMGYKLRGKYAPVKTFNMNMEANLPGYEEISRMAGKVGDEIERKLLE